MQEIQFTLTCQLGDRTTWNLDSPAHVYVDRATRQCLVDLSSLILGIHRVPLSSQSCFVWKEEERQGA